MSSIPSDAGPHAFVDNIEAPELNAEDLHHLGRVRRLRPGDPLTVSDGRGRWRTCRFGEPLEITGDIACEPATSPEITVAFALIKGGRPELVTQKLTELGVDRIVPFVAQRSVVRWDRRRRESNAVKLAGVAREAAMQSHRVWLPEVEPVSSFEDVAGRPQAAMAHPDGNAATLKNPLVMIGPEGGWDDQELAAGLPRIRLGPHILRAETAAIAAAALLTAKREGLM